MIRIIDGRGTGKTSRLMLLAKEQDGIVVCSNPEIYQKKAWNYGITGVEFISYNTYLQDLQSHKWNHTNKPIFIDEIENFLSYMHSNITGYSLSNELKRVDLI